MYVMVYQAEKQNYITLAVEETGEYDYLFKVATKEQQSVMEKENYIKKLNVAEIEPGIVEKREVVCEYMDEDSWKNSDLHLQTGEFPKKEDEIAVEKWFLTQIGITTEDVIGTEIKIYDKDKKSYAKKRITGTITNLNTKSQEEQGTEGLPYILLNRKFHQKTGESGYRNIYVVDKQPQKAESHFETLKKKAEKKGDVNARFNEALYVARGYGENAIILYLTNYVMFLFLVIIMGIFMIMMVNSVMALYMKSQKDAVSILKLVGAPIKMLSVTVRKYIGKILLAGGISGAITSVVLFHFFQYISGKYFGNSESLGTHIPFGWMGAAIVVCLFTAEYIITDKFKIIEKRTAYQVVSEIGDDEGKGKRPHFGTLFTNRRFCKLKMAFRNIRASKWQKISLILCISFSVACVSILGAQVKRVQNTADNNDGYQYEIKMQDAYMDGKIVEASCRQNNLLKICSQYHITPFLNEYQYSTGFKLKKKYLTEEYRKMLSKDVVKKQELDFGQTYVEQSIAVMGYSDEMLKELGKKNGCEIPKLKKGEGIFLQRTVNGNNTGSVALKPLTGDSFSLTGNPKTDKHGNVISEDMNIKVVGSVKNACVYPDVNENYLLLIVSRDTYNDLYNESNLYSFYFTTSQQEGVQKIKEEVAGCSFIKFIDHQEEIRQTKKNYYQSLMIYSAIFVCALLGIFINICLLWIFELKTKKYERTLMNYLGISGKVQYQIFVIEITIIYLIGLILGIAITKGIIYLLHTIVIMDHNNLSSQMLVICSGLVATSYLGSIYVGYKKMKYN